MAFLTAYFDESKSDPMFVLGGFIAPVQAWNPFSRNWKKVLNEYKVPYLHMKEFAFSRGPFKGWAEDDRRAFLGQLLFVITSARKQIYSFSCIFNYQDYDQILDPKLRKEQNHWFFAFRNCVVSITSLCERHNLLSEGEQVNLVFDEQAQFSGRAKKIYSSYKSMSTVPYAERNMLGSLSFADDEELLPLQAADFLAYEINKHHRGFQRQPAFHLNNLKGSHYRWNKEKMKEYAAMMKAGLPGLFLNGEPPIQGIS